MKWAFSDESRRKRTYLMAGVVVPTHAVNDVGRDARGFLRKNQRRVHMAKERQVRRNQFLDLIDALEVEGIAVQVSLSGITDPTARTRTLSALASDLIGQEVEQSEPLLWIADAVAWDATHDRRLERVRIIDLP